MKDPICGMEVNPTSAKFKSSRGPETIYFCSAYCLKKFEGTPVEREIQTSHGSEFICPMHPNVVSSKPGDCPDCGMALESASGDEQVFDTELSSLQRRFYLAAFLAFPVFILGMSTMHHPSPWLIYFEWLATTIVVFFSGFPILKKAYTSIRAARPNMFTLIGIGTLTAYLFSVAVIFHIFPSEHLYFESAAVIMTLVLFGQILELRSRKRLGAAIRSLLNGMPKNVLRVDAAGKDEDVDVTNLRVDDLVRVRPGEQLVVDGVVFEGNASLDESPITGEPLPKEKGIGDWVYSGSILVDGGVIVRAKRVGHHSLIEEMVSLVRNAMANTLPLQRKVDQIAEFFVPTVLAIAILTFFGWWLANPAEGFIRPVLLSVSVLMIACPCALGLATPLSVVVATSRAARLGILVREPSALERFMNIKALLLDKTGTLTEGKPAISSFEFVEKTPETLSKIIQLASSSTHPYSKAIVRWGQSQGIETRKPMNVKSHPGLGLESVEKNEHYYLGSSHFLRSQGVFLSTIENFSVGFAREKTLLAHFSFVDPIRPTAVSALQSLKGKGIDVIMATGDRTNAARDVAKATEIASWYAELLPEAKVELVRKTKEQAGTVAFVGDGINDAAAMASADIGIAVSQGTDLAIESADLVLLNGDLLAILRALALSKAMNHNIRQNLFFAFFYNALGIPIAAGLFLKPFGLMLNPMVAALAMSFSSVTVILNALRLQRKALDA